MQRYLRAGCIGWLAMVAIATPLALTPAIAQTGPMLEALDLTTEQKAEIRSIVQNSRAAVDDILTDDQQAQFQVVYQELQDLRAAIGAVDNLTDEQKTALREVAQTSRTALSEVLTEEQQAELRDLLQENRPRRR